MAFCKQCGADLNGAKFCPSCGTAADGEVAVQQAHAPVGADVRQRSMADMEHMMKYFGAKQAQYDEFDAVCAEVEDRSSRGFGGWIVAAVISVLIGIFAVAGFFFVVAAGCIALYIVLKKKNKEKLAVATARRDELGEELAQYYADYGYCAVGLEYTKPSTLNALYELIRKGRTNTPGDAINIYLADQRDAEMLQLQREATEAAKETAIEAKKTRKAARRAASYSTASFWLK